LKIKVSRIHLLRLIKIIMNCNFKLFIISIIALTFNYLQIGLLFSQSREELDKRKKENLQLLQHSREILKSTTKEKATSLNQINLIQKNIELRQEIIDNISREIEFLKFDIDENNQEISIIQSRLEVLMKEYGELIKNSYKMLDKEYSLIFILSAQDINQGYMRLKYLKYLTDYRKSLIIELDSQKNKLINLNKKLENNKIKNERLLEERMREMRNLDSDKKQKIVLVKSLQLKEIELRKEIQRREKVMIQIENEIKKLIEEEARKAKEANRTSILSEADKILAAEFGKNQGRLPWPTEKGVITGTFGQQNHPILKDVKIKSNGIDISAGQGAEVRSVFNGKVSKVIAIMGANYTVIIRHGDYYTVYQNLIDVRVKSDDIVKTGDLIGTIFTGTDNISKVHFEIWKERKILNPELWLRKY